MPEFTYEALASTGIRSKGTLTAGNEREVMAMLDARGMFPVRIEPNKSVTAGGLRWSRRLKSRHLATFYAQLADLLRSGVPLLRSLDILERQSSQPALAEILREVRARVADGTSLADAMSPHPRAFNELAVSMIRAGQEGGFLEDVLRRIADFTEHQEDLKAKVVGALAYPVFLTIIGFLVLCLLVFVIVPRFEPIFDKLSKQGELPLPTQILLGVSNFLVSWRGLGFVTATVSAVGWFWWWSRTPSGRLLTDGWRLHIPVAGTIYLHYALARFARILGTLLHNGIPILRALKIAEEATGNRVLSLAIDRSAENVKAGDTLANPLAACKYFPRDVVEMIAVGEESNTLETVLVSISEGLEKRTNRQLDLFVRLLEPIMLLFMALIVLVVVAGLLMPVFKMGSIVK